MKRFDLLPAEVAAVDAILQVIRRLEQGSICDAQVLAELPRLIAAEPFSDVARRGGCGVPNLPDELEVSLNPTDSNQRVDADLQFVR